MFIWLIYINLILYLFLAYLYSFRRGGDEAELAVADNNGAGEKVKEALAKSMGTSKATLEDAAKSAAEKVKRTLSDNKEEKKRPKEL
jgi:hypothetical protein